MDVSSSTTWTPFAERRAHRHVRLNRSALHRRPKLSASLLFEDVADLCPAGIVVIDAAGRIRYTNRRTQQMIGLSAEDYSARDYNSPSWKVTDFSGRPMGDDELIFARVMRDRVPMDDIEHAVERADGSRIYLRISGQPVLDAAGAILQVIFTMVDVSSTILVEQALKASEQRFASALEFAPIGMAIVSLEGRFTLVNQALCQITGYDKPELQQLTFQEITFPEDLQADLDNVRDLLAGRRLNYQMEKRYIRKDRGVVWIRLSVSLPRGVNGEPLYFIAQIEDITARRQASERIRSSEERMRLMLNSVVDYEILMLDTEGHITDANPGAELIKGYRTAELIGQTIQLFYLPEDLKAGKPRRELDAAARSGRHEDEGWRLRRDGSRFWANVILNAMHDDDGTLRGYCMVTRDLTASRRTELELREGKERLEQSMRRLERQNREASALSELSSVLQSCLRLEEIYTPVRRFCRKLFPGCAGALYIMHASRNALESVISWDERAPLTTMFEPQECWGLRRGQLHEHCNEDDLRCAHIAEDLKNDTLCVPMMAQSEILGMLHLQPSTAMDALSAEDELTRRRQLAEMASERIGMAIANLRLRESLRNQSIRDPLTKLHNRRYLEETMQRELAQARRANQPLALMMMDVDHFKAYNDTHGHEGGDAALAAIANVLQGRCRSSDIVCRHGGEELVMVLTNTTAEQSLARAEDTRRAIAAAYIVNRGTVLPPTTISIGIALFPEHAADYPGLLNAADKALYAAKDAGRNCVQLATAPPLS